MSHEQPANHPTTASVARRRGNAIRKLATGAIAAATVAGLALTTTPAALAGNGHGNAGAAIGLGILGGVIAGAAIASTIPPAYGAPPPAYYYPQPGYYYSPSYYGAPQPYNGSPYGYYPQYNYQ